MPETGLLFQMVNQERICPDLPVSRGGVRIGEEDRSFGEFGYWWTSSPSNRSNGAFNTMDLRNYMETAVLPGAPSLSMEWAGCVRFVKDL